MFNPFTPSSARTASLVLVAAFLATVGCVKVEDGGRGRPVTKVKDANNATMDGKPAPDVVMVPATPGPSAPLFSEAIDPCAARLHDIEGLLLKYYIAHRRLPDRLEDVAPLAEPGQKIDFTCPFSGRPYVYIPQQLIVGGQQQVLAFAPAPGRDGRYRVIILRPATGSSIPALPDVVTYSPDQIKPYLQAATAAPKPAPGGS
jgi:hypothetical protein